MYEGTPKKVNSIFASYNMTAEAQYSPKKKHTLLRVSYTNANFTAIGEPTNDSFLGQTIQRIVKSYL